MNKFTPAITPEWLSDNDHKFSAYSISAEALALINMSETLKSDMRAYAASEYTAAGKIHTTHGAGEYQPPVSTERRGFLTIASDRLATPEGAVSILAHELGHFRVEEPNATIANARANAVAARDKTAYEAACHATEGYAHYNEVKVRGEILQTIRSSAEIEQRPLSAQESKLEAKWRGEGVYGQLDEGKEYLITKRISKAAEQESKHMTPAQAMESSVYALAENNKDHITSTTRQTYAVFCSDGATKMTSPSGTTGGFNEQGQRAQRGQSIAPSPDNDLSSFLDRMLAADDTTFRSMQQVLAALPPGQQILGEGIAQVDREERTATHRVSFMTRTNSFSARMVDESISILIIKNVRTILPCNVI